MRLLDLLKNVQYKRVDKSNRELNTEIYDVVNDSRRAKEDTVFICIEGAVADGHNYIKNVIENNCKCILIQKDIDELEYTQKDAILENDIIVIKTQDTRLALSYMSAALFNYPGEKLTTIAITGTKGKTTTSYMIRTILEDAGISTGIIGTTGVCFKDKHIETHNTTPESYDIQKYLKMMADENVSVCVMEVSSQALKLNRTAGIIFDYGIFTNLSPDHIGENEHADYEEYVFCKSLLFKQCKQGIFNLDDKETPSMIRNCTCKIHTYGFDETADLNLSNVEYIVRGSFIGIGFNTHGVIEDRFEVNTPGKFSAYNAMAAILTTYLLNIDIMDMKTSLTHIFVKGRVESIHISDKFTLLIDYAHNAMSMESLLTTIKEYNPKRIVSLFGCGGNRSKLRRYEMGEISGKYADLSIITADNSRFENVLDIIEDILIGMNKTTGKNIVIPNRKEAIKYSILNAKEGDIILLLGKGHEDYQEIEGIRHPFDERVIIKEILEEIRFQNGD